MRYRLDIEYDGTGLYGFQRQEGLATVQGLLEAALEKMTGHPEEIFAAGRTDAGVHALHQVVHVDLAKEWPRHKLIQGLNFYLMDAPVSVINAEAVAGDFHARFSATERRYWYRILNRSAPPSVWRDRVWHVHPTTRCLALDVQAMQAGADFLVGKHDFTSFRASECQAKNPVKTVELLRVERPESYPDEVHIHVAARSFLHHMVRNISGTLVKVGKGEWQPEKVREILAAKDRVLAGQTAPACGLYLVKVAYENGNVAL